VKAGILSALDVPQQTLRTQQLQNGVDLWCSLDVDARFELWKQIAPRLSQLPLADTLAAMGGFIAVFESMIDLKDIALILGVR